MNKRIILCAPAAGGKDFFRDWLTDNTTFKKEVSYTTRPPRKGEVDGQTYNFVTEEFFLEQKDKDLLYEAVNFNGWWYGTTREDWRYCKLFIMTPSGIKHLTEEDRKNCIVVYFDIPLEIRKKRLSLRSDSDTVDRRLVADQNDFAPFKDFDIRITNPTFNPKAVHQLITTYGNFI